VLVTEVRMWEHDHA